MLEGSELVVGTGKFGPYVRYDGKFYSLKRGVDDPYTITAERAAGLIAEKQESEKKKVIADFGEIQVLNGRYGPYITMDKNNFRIPKEIEPNKLTKEECLAIIEKGGTKKKSTKTVKKK